MCVDPGEPSSTAPHLYRGSGDPISGSGEGGWVEGGRGGGAKTSSHLLVSNLRTETLTAPRLDASDMSDVPERRPRPSPSCVFASFRFPEVGKVPAGSILRLHGDGDVFKDSAAMDTNGRVTDCNVSSRGGGGASVLLTSPLHLLLHLAV